MEFGRSCISEVDIFIFSTWNNSLKSESVTCLQRTITSHLFGCREIIYIDLLDGKPVKLSALLPIDMSSFLERLNVHSFLCSFTEFHLRYYLDRLSYLVPWAETYRITSNQYGVVATHFFYSRFLRLKDLSPSLYVVSS